MLDLLIRGGEVVTPQGVGKWDVAIQGERIVAITLPDARAEAARVIDATGKLVVPGGIEPHTHLAHFVSMHPEDDLFTLGPEEDTRGMVFGGTTTPSTSASSVPARTFPRPSRRAWPAGKASRTRITPST